MESTGWKSDYRSDESFYSWFSLPSEFTSLFWLLLATILVCPGMSGIARAVSPTEIKEQTGYTLLKSVLNSNLPTGSGVPISQVEASIVAPPNPEIYFPDATYSEFLATGDPFSQNINFVDASGGASNGTSAHSYVNVGRYFYGNNFSFAPGANSVTIYETNNWLTNVLKMGSSSAPVSHDFRVENYSWVGSGGTLYDNEALGRLDYLIDNNNITAVAGVIPGDHPLLGSSLNAIAVGTTEGSNPTTPTSSGYFPGRNKPDLVAPGTLASETTAIVSSAATMLYDSGDGTDAAKSETMKAILLAGASKDDLPSWNQTSTVPLDSTYGAGVLNVYNSYLIQAGGKFPATAAPVGIDGWDYGIATNGTSQYYTFEVPLGSTASELSIALTWNAEVTDLPGSGFSPDVSLDNLDLFLRDSMGNLEAKSESGAAGSYENNVEHIYLTGLTEGTYTLELSNLTPGGSRDFGLAWRMETFFNTSTADFNVDGKTDGADFLAWQRGFGTYAGATLGLGDGNGDTDVDSDDLLIFEAEFGAISSTTTALAVVPEPGTIGMASIGLFTLSQFCRFLGRRDY